MFSPNTPDAAAIVERARQRFGSGATRPLAWRRTQLQGLERMITQHVSQWEAALSSDLGKSRTEAHIAELSIVLGEVRLAQRRLHRWARSRVVPGSVAVQPALARIRPEPRGVALVIAPWNYPVQLQLTPVVGALAAGCAVVMKPSELAPATAALIADLTPRYLDQDAVHVVTGGVTTSTKLLEQRWDLIFATGSERLGRAVAAAAATHLTPCVLELGGACPVWVDRSANLAVAARRIAWAKTMNAGQTCVAPNHVFVDAPVHDEFVQLLVREVVAQRDDGARLVTPEHVARVAEFVADGHVRTGGIVERESRRMQTTVLTDVSADAPSVVEEVFGPVLSIVRLDSAAAFINLQRSRPLPLALYAFAESARVLNAIETQTSSGAFGRNIALAHLQVSSLPFGGVGASGYGTYHGKFSFDTFSHRKAVLSKPTRPDTIRLVTNPMTPRKWSVLRHLL